MTRETIAAKSVFTLEPAEPNPKASAYSFHFSFYDVCKRAVDFTFSFLVTTLILSWLIPILGIIIRLDSKGPVFFVQTRIGYLGIPFKCYKLRTMVVNQDSDTVQAQRNDVRITAVGRFLRTTNLDELPQFLNVLFGDMSLVGPRPFMLKDDEEFGSVVSNYYLRSYAKPGITGMAQAKGCRGKTETDLDIIHRYQWDAFYIRHAGMWLDIKIIAITAQQTFVALFQAAGSKARLLRSRFSVDVIQMNVNKAA